MQIQKEAAAREAAIADMQRKIGELERTHEAHRAELERALREKVSKEGREDRRRKRKRKRKRK